MIDLTGKVILVTGGGRGIGEAIVRTAIRVGGSVIVHDLDTAGPATHLLREFGPDKCHLVPGDLARPDIVPSIWRTAMQWRDRVDVVINNAGIYEPAAINGEFDSWSASWHRTLEINLVSVCHFCRESIRHFQERGGGIIINIASRAAFRGDDPDYMHYAASKAGIVAMSRTIARHFGRQNITVFTIAPGFVRTDLNRVFFERFGIKEAAKESSIGEIAEPQDIANSVIFLASGLAKQATGAVLDINGASYVR
jgi:3-oxoacyl-[acyl-carrier protein] reductase